VASVVLLSLTAAAATATASARTAFAQPPPPPPPSSSSQQHPPQQHPPLRTLLIDNYDSYTYNLAHYLAEVNGGTAPLVVYNDECGGDWRELLARHGPFDNVVISPGMFVYVCPCWHLTSCTHV
jgi:para-aminobenzoate synthetase